MPGAALVGGSHLLDLPPPEGDGTVEFVGVYDSQQPDGRIFGPTLAEGAAEKVLISA